MTGYIEPPVFADTELSFWKTICKFSEIDIKPNTLVLCDIDDTLLHHPAINNAWISLMNSFFYAKYPTQEKANNKMIKFVDKVFQLIPIEHTDRDGFFNMLEKSHGFAFVTARTSSGKDFTYSNLISLDIDPEKYPVHFCGYEPKGQYINRVFDLSKYDNVVFIDDQERNLDNVLLMTTHLGLKLYKFERDTRNSQHDYYPLPPGFDPSLRFDGEKIVRI